jgi:hypothetical protein
LAQDRDRWRDLVKRWWTFGFKRHEGSLVMTGVNTYLLTQGEKNPFQLPILNAYTQDSRFLRQWKCRLGCDAVWSYRWLLMFPEDGCDTFLYIIGKPHTRQVVTQATIDSSTKTVGANALQN